MQALQYPLNAVNTFFFIVHNLFHVYMPEGFSLFQHVLLFFPMTVIHTSADLV